jgi:hypothetical protein
MDLKYIRKLHHIKRNGQRRYKYLAYEGTNLILQKHSDSTIMFSETDIINMLDFLIENMFAMLGGRVFQQTLRVGQGMKHTYPYLWYPFCFKLNGIDAINEII